MTAPEARLRPHPIDRFAGDEHVLDIPAALRALRSESRATTQGHRQITWMHKGPVRLVLFAFEAGGRIREHAANGWVTIHSLRGTVSVRTPDTLHVLTEGTLLSLAPQVSHDVEASEEADVLLGIYPESAASEQ